MPPSRAKEIKGLAQKRIPDQGGAEAPHRGAGMISYFIGAAAIVVMGAVSGWPEWVSGALIVVWILFIITMEAIDAAERRRRDP
jgi:Flp pilus assembly protein TadB